MIFDAMVPWEYRESWDFVHVWAGCLDVIDDGWHPFLRVLTNQSVKRWIHWSVPRVKQPHKIINSTNHQSPSTWSQKCIDETCIRLPSDTQRNISWFLLFKFWLHAFFWVTVPQAAASWTQMEQVDPQDKMLPEAAAMMLEKMATWVCKKN